MRLAREQFIDGSGQRSAVAEMRFIERQIARISETPGRTHQFDVQALR